MPMAQQEVNNSLGCGTPAEGTRVDTTSPAKASWLPPRCPGEEERTLYTDQRTETAVDARAEVSQEPVEGWGCTNPILQTNDRAKTSEISHVLHSPRYQQKVSSSSSGEGSV